MKLSAHDCRRQRNTKIATFLTANLIIRLCSHVCIERIACQPRMLTFQTVSVQRMAMDLFLAIGAVCFLLGGIAVLLYVIISKYNVSSKNTRLWTSFSRKTYVCSTPTARRAGVERGFECCCRKVISRLSKCKKNSRTHYKLTQN